MMMELTFIPLKTPEGATCGFARVSGGFAELKLRAPVDGQAAVLTESGVVEGPPASRIAVPGGRVQAVAVHEDGQLRCFGIARGAALGVEQVRARLMARRDAANAKAAREPAAEAAKAGAGTGGAARAVAADAAAQEPPKTAVNAPEAGTGEAKAAATGGVPEPAAAPGAAKAAVTVELVPPAGPREAGAGTQAATGAPEAGAGERDVPAVEAGEEDAEDAPASIEQSAADSESFMALLRRADAAFARLSERHAPGVAPASSTAAQLASAPLRRSARHDGAQPAMQQPAAQPGGSAAPRTDAPSAPAAPAETPAAAPSVARRFPEDAAQWGEEIDRLLEDCGAAEQREPIANPFPNIFPGARFQRVTRPGMQPHLEGDWQRGGERLRITAVPGAYSPHPPAHLMDFTRYIRARSGGYWIRVTAY